ncbi:MAG: FAD-dependent oxidoreductase [Clostridium sp.]|nr:FAD-dependent oxidoreductase [Clostridium sp.]
MAGHYDLVVIGGGPGGYTAAEHAALLGMRTVLIEKEEVGGACINTGCVPAKSMLQATCVYRDLRRSARFGITIGDVRYDYAGLQKYKEENVRKLREGVLKRLRESGAELIYGSGYLHRNNAVEIMTAAGTEYVYGEHVIIATGAKPVIPDIPGVGLPQVMTSRKLMAESEWAFDRLVIIGGGVIGVELATIYASLGASVTMLEMSSRLLDNMDETISCELRESLEDKGVQVLCGVHVTGIRENSPGETEGQVQVEYKKGFRQYSIPADRVLISAGRRPRMSDVLSEDCEVRLHEDGRPITRAPYRTTQEGVFAIGDTVARMRLAHVAASQGAYVVEHIAKKGHRLELSIVPNGMFVSLPLVPICIFADPEIACVGFSEEDARRYNMKVKIGVAMMEDNGKAILSDQKRGFVKLLFEAYTNTLVGAHIMCLRATDMIGEMATAIANGLTAYQLQMAMRAYPTYGQSIARAIADALKEDAGQKEQRG